MTPGRPSAPAAAAARAAAAPPSRIRRWGVRAGVALLLLLVLAWAAFTYLFYNPFEGTVASLDRVVPSDAAFAIRGAAPALLATPFVRRHLLGRVDGLLTALGRDPAELHGLAEEIGRSEERVNAALPTALRGFTLAGDVLGGEAVLFGVPDLATPDLSKVCLATRLTSRARMILGVFKHDWARRRVEAEGRLRVVRLRDLYEVDTSALVGGPRTTTTGFAAVVKDVLVVGNDRALVEEAARLARTGGAGSLPDRQDAADALLGGEDAPPLRAFLDLPRLAQDRAPAAGGSPGERMRAAGGVPGLLAFLVDPDALGSLRAAVLFPGPDECAAEVAATRNEKSPSAVAQGLAEAAGRPAREALAEAAALAPAGSAAFVLRLELPPGLLARMLYGRAPPEIRDAVDGGLRKAGSSIEAWTQDLDGLLLPGVSVVVERLPDCDALPLDDYDADASGRFVEPLPGVLFAFRQRPEAGPGAAERWFRGVREKSDFREFADLPAPEPGVRMFRAVPKYLRGDQDLVRPAAAFEGDLVLVASNEGTLRRALEARAGRRRALGDDPEFAARAAAAGEGQAHAFADLGPVLLLMKDRRREVATGRSTHDWVKERREVMRDLVVGSNAAVVDQEQLQRLVENEMDRRIRRMKDFEFPEKKRLYVEELRGLEVLRDAGATLAWGPDGVVLRATVRTKEK